ncbi:MAG: PAS domain-containing protein [Anaerolineales bacterium]|nr:PAS domain-containing protein [Anaerolineales bacterium]
MKENYIDFIPGDSEKELSASLLRSLVIGILFLSGMFILSALLVFHELIARAAFFSGTAALICLLTFWLIRRRKLRLAGLIFVAFLWLIVSFGAYTATGVAAPIFFGYAAVILIGALVLGVRTGLWLVFLSVGFGGFMIYADAYHFLPDAKEYSLMSRLFIYAFFFFVILLLQKTAVDTTRNAISRANTSEMMYRSFLENISTVTYINDTSLGSLTTYVSPQVIKIIGYSQDEFLVNPLLWMDILHPADRENVILENNRTSETGEPFLMEYRLISKDQQVVWVRDEASLIRNEQGQPQYWLGAWTDITQRKNSETAQRNVVEALTRRTIQLQTAGEVSRAATSILELDVLLSKVVELICSHFDYYYVGIFLADEKHEIVVLRAATGEMGQTMLNFQHSLPVASSSMVGWCVKNNQARIALDVGEDAVHFKNPILPLTRSELALPLRARGDVIGAMTIQSDRAAAFTEADITALQTMADQVANAIETARLFDDRSRLIKELETKNAELERFSYTVSHDLKSPLVTIRGFVGYLREDARKGDMIRFDNDLARVINATDKMQNLLSDLLELSRVGRIINPLENIEFSEIIKETLSLVLNPLMLDAIQVEILDPLPIVCCDRARIVEVLQNLVTNAVKFMGEQSAPHIQIGAAGFDNNSGYPILFVKDNGVGIEAQYHERVFGLFNRLSSDNEGTGIGLAIVKRIIEVHGGRIWLESAGRNKGSTFYFTLPFAEGERN